VRCGGLPLFGQVLIYAATMVSTHLFRAWRWKYLLRPIGGVPELPRLMIISTVGFMAILALPSGSANSRAVLVVAAGSPRNEPPSGYRSRWSASWTGW